MKEAVTSSAASIVSNEITSCDERETSPEQAAGHLTRRTFLRNVSVTVAAIAATACGGGGASGSTLGGDNAAPSTGQPQASNQPPAWNMVPTITFTQGIAASFSIAAYVTDAENDALSITKNAVALPAGVTYDAATKSFVYDGVGEVAATEGHVLLAAER